MFNHEPVDYRCPFCLVASGGEDEVTAQDDLVLESVGAFAFVSSRWWPNNKGQVLVAPRAHHENLYDLPAADGYAVHDLVREVAVAIRSTYGCSGVSTRQHNEPDGHQDAWHLHVHVFPRYRGDNLYGTRHLETTATPDERAPYAQKLRRYFADA
ncbi:HIT family protein [Kribbella qitaiheensis]|uniref:HIT family protein n=1 Tax=Kribbella qitaiheensis TaxID=1544730 RepID=A0A7G6X9H2_9ACTN|nr:HIT family protein [Kribbella qitaiheensis]